MRRKFHSINNRILFREKSSLAITSQDYTLFQKKKETEGKTTKKQYKQFMHQRNHRSSLIISSHL